MIVRAFFDTPTPPVLVMQFPVTRQECWRWQTWLQQRGFSRTEARRLVFLRLWFRRVAQKAEVAS